MKEPKIDIDATGGVDLERLGRSLLLHGERVGDGRYHVTGEDLRALALPVLRHRVLTNYQAESDGKSVDEVLREVVNR